jgi:amino acid transporter
MATSAPPASGTQGSPVVRKGLKLGAIGLISSIVIAIASTAPAYSLTSALGSVVAEVGTRAPVAILLAFVPMLFISFAYRSLNEVDPDCGTSFTWVARAFGRRTGWLTGWVIVVADVIVMANLAQIAGSYTFQLFGATDLAGNTFWVTLLGCAWILLMTLIAWIGIEMSARTQVVLLSLELLVLAVFAVTALVEVYSGHAGGQALHVSLGWFNPFGGGMTFGALSAGFLAGVFIYWGWDSAVAANEETRHPAITPGRAAVISTIVLLVTYLLVTIAAQAYAGVGSKGIGLTSDAASEDALSASSCWCWRSCRRRWRRPRPPSCRRRGPRCRWPRTGPSRRRSARSAGGSGRRRCRPGRWASRRWRSTRRWPASTTATRSAT